MLKSIKKYYLRLRLLNLSTVHLSELDNYLVMRAVLRIVGWLVISLDLTH